MTFDPFGTPVNQLSRQATTGPGGFVLQNATPTILTWVAPNDGQLHQFNVIAAEVVTALETGGQIKVNWVQPDGVAATSNIFSAGQAAGEYSAQFQRLVQAGSTVTLTQASALTAGAAQAWAELWGV